MCSCVQVILIIRPGHGVTADLTCEEGVLRLQAGRGMVSKAPEAISMVSKGCHAEQWKQLFAAQTADRVLSTMKLPRGVDEQPAPEVTIDTWQTTHQQPYADVLLSAFLLPRDLTLASIVAWRYVLTMLGWFSPALRLASITC